jgi:hypothetical protein
VLKDYKGSGKQENEIHLEIPPSPINAPALKKRGRKFKRYSSMECDKDNIEKYQMYATNPDGKMISKVWF